MSVCNGKSETGRSTTGYRERQGDREERRGKGKDTRQNVALQAIAVKKQANGRKNGKESLAPVKRLSVFLFCVDGDVRCFLLFFLSFFLVDDSRIVDR